MDARPKKRAGPLTWLSARTWRFWVGVLMLLPVLYVATFGPACWIVTRTRYGPHVNSTLAVYEPLLYVIVATPSELQPPVEWYLGLGAPAGRKPRFLNTPLDYGIEWAYPQDNLYYMALSRPRPTQPVKPPAP